MNRFFQAILLTIIIIFAGFIGYRVFSKLDTENKGNKDNTEVSINEIDNTTPKNNAESIKDNKEPEEKVVTAPAVQVTETKSLLPDINKATVIDLKKAGLTKKLAERVLHIRETVGVFYSVNDLGGIKGIGKKRIESLEKQFCVDKENIDINTRKLNINLISDEDIYGVLGLNKKEIEKVKKWKKEKGKIFSNVEMMALCESQEHFEYISKRIYYTDY